MRNYVCFNCGFDSLVKYTKCPACDATMTKLSFKDNREFNNLAGGEPCELWIENKIGHKIPDDLVAKRIECRNRIFKKREQEKEREKMANTWTYSASSGANSFKVKCPYCNSTNVKKITTGSRMVSTAMVGINSSKIGKQWHCNNCSSNF